MRKVWLALACLVLQACSLPQALPSARELNAGSAEVAVIGKIELVPPIDSKLEQRRHWNVIGEGRALDQIIMATGAADRPVTTSKLDGANFQHSLEAPWGVPFMVNAPRRRTFLNGGVTYLDVMAQEKLWFPGGYFFDVPPGAAAVYIGTLRYHRNDFNTITKVEVIDEREDIAVVLKGSGASPQQVRLSLLKRVR